MMYRNKHWEKHTEIKWLHPWKKILCKKKRFFSVIGFGCYIHREKKDCERVKRPCLSFLLCWLTLVEPKTTTTVNYFKNECLLKYSNAITFTQKFPIGVTYSQRQLLSSSFDLSLTLGGPLSLYWILLVCASVLNVVGQKKRLDPPVKYLNNKSHRKMLNST